MLLVSSRPLGASHEDMRRFPWRTKVSKARYKTRVRLVSYARQAVPRVPKSLETEMQGKRAHAVPNLPCKFPSISLEK